MMERQPLPAYHDDTDDSWDKPTPKDIFLDMGGSS